MPRDVWEIDRKVLNRLVDSFTDGTLDGLPIEVIAQEQGLDITTAEQSLLRLYSATPPYLVPRIDLGKQRVPEVVGITERGLRATGAWPAKRDATTVGDFW